MALPKNPLPQKIEPYLTPRVLVTPKVPAMMLPAPPTGGGGKKKKKRPKLSLDVGLVEGSYELPRLPQYQMSEMDRGNFEDDVRGAAEPDSPKDPMFFD